MKIFEERTFQEGEESQGENMSSLFGEPQGGKCRVESSMEKFEGRRSVS